MVKIVIFQADWRAEASQKILKNEDFHREMLQEPCNLDIFQRISRKNEEKLHRNFIFLTFLARASKRSLKFLRVRKKMRYTGDSVGYTH